MGAAEALGGVRQHKFRRALGIAHNFGVPKPNYAPAEIFQIGGTACIIALLIQMLASVEFDRQLGFAAGQIEDVVSNHQLPGKGWSIAR